MLEREYRIKRAWKRIKPHVDFSKQQSWFAPDITLPVQIQRWEPEPDWSKLVINKFEYRLNKYKHEHRDDVIVYRVECEGVILDEFVQELYS